MISLTHKITHCHCCAKLEGSAVNDRHFETVQRIIFIYKPNLYICNKSIY